ncbi:MULTISPECIES: UDP-N-acetylmuramate dehydrogenase [unclassified Neptuniibacter]|uniref:UDP-N-acetylmuramate dehydrogenase n=1 Tax=unclassified Neptuniibacter TaxID=2630693 RepID=UPI0025E46E32|nr:MULTISPECIES: UDP-N-acetylmuramate dehydrogenase [unclassified Neptuniibacter]|tara:strand:- start:2553 stop:3572 length:1020 start_codon:yes stop_codon:yes gene_type:complete
MQWQNNADLTAQNSFGFSVTAEHYCKVDQIDQLEDALKDVEEHGWPLLVLGGGSNLVLSEKIPGAVISVMTQGVNVLVDDEDSAIVEVGAGENWHDLVGQLLQMGLHGLENLALIPGNVGAAPVQNIGAYGVEMSDCFHSLTAYDMQTKGLVQLSAEECRFGYRDSLFKSIEKGRYIIWSVRFCLSSIFKPVLTYRGLVDYLAEQGINQPSSHQVYKAVCDIRMSKLPSPAIIGNAGSFFENPVVSEADFLSLKLRYQNIVAFKDRAGFYKLAAGWLIDQAGWKGHIAGSVGVYDQQALVLINKGGGDSVALLALASKISDSVESAFGVKLKIEPRVYP